MRAQLLVLLAACLLAAYSNPTHAKSYEEQVQDDQNSVMDHFGGGFGGGDDHHEEENEEDGEFEDEDDDDEKKPKPQKVEEADCSSVDVVFIVDQSSSINKEDKGNFKREMTFVREIVRKLNIGSGHDQGRSAMIKFSTDERTQILWNNLAGQAMSQKELIQRIDGIEYDNKDATRLPKAFDLLRDQVLPKRRFRRATIVITITDGEPTDDEGFSIHEESKEKGEKLLEDLRNVVHSGLVDNKRPVLYVGVGVTKQERPYLNQVLNTISSTGKHIQVNGYQSIDTNLKTYLNKICDDIEKSKCKGAAMDVVLVVDHSASIDENGGKGTFDNIVRPFLVNVVDNLDLSITRLAMVRFSEWSKTKVDWTLKESEKMSEKDIINKVKSLQYDRGEWTQTYRALKLTKDMVDSERDPERTLMIIIVTDGRPEYRANPARGQPDLSGGWLKGNKDFAMVHDKIKAICKEMNDEPNVSMFPVIVNIRKVKDPKWARKVMIAMTSSQTWDDVIMTNDFGELTGKVKAIHKKVCKTYECQLKTKVRTECRFKSNKITLEITQMQYDLKTDKCVTGETRQITKKVVRRAAEPWKVNATTSGQNFMLTTS